MPRRLEIRTTILEKKSNGRSREKDANANDVYADEALQLLEEIEQLKSNVSVIDGPTADCQMTLTRPLFAITSWTNRWPACS